MGECVTSDASDRVGNVLCIEPVNPVFARVFAHRASDVRRAPHCTAHES